MARRISLHSSVNGPLPLLPDRGAEAIQVMCSDRFRQRPEVREIVDDRNDNDAFHGGEGSMG